MKPYIPYTESWKEFFELYKQLPTLWDSSCNAYKNREEKNKAWELLLEKYKEIEPNANLQNVKSKLHNIRYCYRREVKKANLRSNKVSNKKENYIPILWYFDHLNFLRDVTYHVPARVPKSEASEDTNDDTIQDDEDNENEFFMKPIKQRIDDDPLENETAEIEAPTTSMIKEERDEAAIYAACWQVQFQKIPAEQQIFAKKAIDDILFLGQIGQLSFNTVQMPTNLS